MKNKVDKTVGLWLILRINSAEYYPSNRSLVDINGEVIKSNFVKRNFIRLPMIASGFRDCDIDDVIRMTWFTKQSKIQRDEDESLAMADEGIRYEKLVSSCWNLLYEDDGRG